MRCLLIFLDGVGLGDNNVRSNPFTAANLPTFHSFADSAVTTEAHGVSSSRATVIGVDALLGFEGLPQSGTGQSTLLTGRNTVEVFGRHFGPWVPVRLREVTAHANLLVQAKADGRTVAFANAYPEELLRLAQLEDLGKLVGPLRAGPPLAALGAGVLTRATPELNAGRALSSEITNEGWRERLKRAGLPHVTAYSAGGNLARITHEHDLTLYAHYATDAAGHTQTMDEAVEALELVDSFLSGVLDALEPDVLLLIVSDHGNIEDVRTGHTRNPALSIVAGPGHGEFAQAITDLTSVAPTVKRILDKA